MQTLTVNIQSDALVDKVVSLLEGFKNDGLEIISQEDTEDLKLLKLTKNEATVSFENYLQ